MLDNERIDTVNEKIRLIQKKNGLTFGTDAYLLAAYIKKQPRGLGVDLGSGTGIIPMLLLSREKLARVVAVEIQPDFCDLIRRNAELNGMEDKLVALEKDIRSLSNSDIRLESADVVFSNPPYMKSDSGKRNEHDAKFIARHEVCGDISDFCKAAEKLLKYGGLFYCVYRTDRLADLVFSMRECHLEPKKMTFVHADTETPPSMVLVEAKKGASSSLKVTKPLILYKSGNVDGGQRELTENAQKIYDTCSFEHIL